MNLLSKAAIFAVTASMMILNVLMLLKLIDRLETRYGQPYVEAQNNYAPNDGLTQRPRNPAVATPEKTRLDGEVKTPAKTLAYCLIDASHFYKVPPAAMVGIMHVEGGRVGKESGPNADGTYDLGPMQINSIWVPQLARAWGVDTRKARAVMRDDGCMNVKVAAWILHKNISETGSVYGGIAHYHSATPGLGKPFAAKVMAAVEKKGLRID